MTISRILQLHNRYLHFGGEDIICQSEHELLTGHGHEVKQVFFDNRTIGESWSSKWEAGLRAIHNPEAAHVLARELKDFRPDVVHVHNFFPLISPAVFRAAKSMGIPVVATINNYRLICCKATLFRDNHICEKCTQSFLPVSGIRYRCYHDSAIQSAAVTLMSSWHKAIGTWRQSVDRYILAMTNFGAQKIIQSSLKLPAEKCVVKPNFVRDPGVGDLPRDDYFLFFGRLSLEKGINTLLQAQAQAQFPLLIAGDGPLKPSVLNASQQSSRLRYVGFQTNDQVKVLIKRAKAVIFPSVWYEGMPLALLETLACGTPVIISDLQPFQELITDHVDGLIFRTGDADDLAKKITEFERLPQQIYQNARETYLTHYTPERNYELLINIYRDAFNAHGKKKCA